MTALTFTAYGEPAPQGSKLRTKFGLVDDNAKRLKPWRKAVTAAAEAALLDLLDSPSFDLPLAEPVIVDVCVSLARPAKHYRTGRFADVLREDAPGFPVVRGCGDSDKYLRAICDALTDAGVWLDDVLVVQATVRKAYVHTGGDALSEPGAVIRVRAAGYGTPEVAA